MTKDSTSSDRLPVDIPRGVAAEPSLSWPAKAILGRIRWHARETGEAYPGEVTLASELGISVRTVRRALRQLEGARLISTARRGKRKTNLYGVSVTGQSDRSPAGGDRSIWPVVTGQSDRSLGTGQSGRSNSTERSRREELAASWPQTIAMTLQLAQRQGWTAPDSLLHQIITAAAPEIPTPYDPDATLAEALHVAEGQRSPGLWPKVIGRQIRAAIAAGVCERHRRAA